MTAKFEQEGKSPSYLEVGVIHRFTINNFPIEVLPYDPKCGFSWQYARYSQEKGDPRSYFQSGGGSRYHPDEAKKRPPGNFKLIVDKGTITAE